MPTPQQQLSVLPLYAVSHAPAPSALPALESASDDELMRLANAGLRLAFDELVHRYQARAIGVALRQTGGLAIAQEIAQETFVDVFRALPAYQPRGKFRGFLFRILINRCRMEHRKRERERKAHESLAVVAHETAELATALILARERERRLNAAVCALSPALREVLSLWAEGLKDKEIGEVLRRPVGTIRRRRFDALERLRAQLEGQ